MKKKILVISFSNLDSDPRVNRQINFLRKDYNIFTIGFKSSELEGVIHYNIQLEVKSIFNKIKYGFKLLFGLYDNYYINIPHVSQTDKILKENEFDLIIANDIDTLPIVLKNRKKAKVIFDSHEYAPKEYENDFMWKLFFQKYKMYLCEKYINSSDQMLTVCDGIALEYEKEYSKKCEIITNAPTYEDNLTPSIVEEKIRIIHHGGAIPFRKIELMIETMKFVDDRFELNLMLMPSNEDYLNKLKDISKNMTNVKFIEPVSMRDIPSFINRFDIGFYILEPLNFNFKYALPNKIFEFIQARLCIVIGPSLEMSKIVNKFSLGIVSEDFTPDSLANIFNSLTIEDINRFKENSNIASKELSSESNKEKLLNLVNKVMV